MSWRLNDLPDHVALAGLQNLVAAADIFSDQPDAHHRDADQEEHDSEQREEAALFRSEHQPAPGEYQYKEEAAPGAGEREHREQLDGGQRESGDEVKIEPD